MNEPTQDCPQCGKSGPYCHCQTSVATVPKPQPTELSLTATKPVEMEQCQLGLIEWCARKILSIKADADELQEAFKQAVEKKWKSSTLKRHYELALKRVDYYNKIKWALEAGFIIVPNFPVTLFAVRTDRTKPLKLVSTYRHASHEQKCQALPQGEGDYKNPQPVIFERSGDLNDPKQPGKKWYQFWAEKFQELDFPINMAKPHIMEATDNAMALKIFDEFGVLPSPYRKRDPLIVARIRDPKAPKWDKDGVITFIVAWHLDTRTL